MPDIFIGEPSLKRLGGINFGRSDVTQVLARPLLSSNQIGAFGASHPTANDAWPERVVNLTTTGRSFRKRLNISRIDPGGPSEPEYYPILSARFRVMQGAFCNIRLFMRLTNAYTIFYPCRLDAVRDGAPTVVVHSISDPLSYHGGIETDTALSADMRDISMFAYQNYWEAALPGLAFGHTEMVSFVFYIHKLNISSTALYSDHACLLIE